MIIPANVLYVIALTPALIVGAVLVAYAVAGHVDRRADIKFSRDPDPTGLWASARRDQILRGAKLGTQEIPIVPTVSLLTATLDEARTYVAEQVARRRREHREFIAIMKGLPA
jgi:hypothetical protein